MAPVGSHDATGFAATYIHQAETYDSTRSAGRETIGPLLTALAAAPRLRDEHYEELSDGLKRLADDIEFGRLPDSYDRDLHRGDAYLVTWQIPE